MIVAGHPSLGCLFLNLRGLELLRWVCPLQSPNQLGIALLQGCTSGIAPHFVAHSYRDVLAMWVWLQRRVPTGSTEVTGLCGGMKPGQFVITFHDMPLTAKSDIGPPGFHKEQQAGTSKGIVVSLSFRGKQEGGKA